MKNPEGSTRDAERPLTPERLTEIRKQAEIDRDENAWAFWTENWWRRTNRPLRMAMELLELLADRDALIAAGDVLATRLDETPALEDYTSTWAGLDEKTKQRQQAVRAWLAVAHPNGEGHKP